MSLAVKFIRKYPGIAAFIILLLFRIAFGLSPAFFDAAYFNSVFPIIRRAQSALSFLWILPGYYLLLLFLVAWLIFRFTRPRNTVHFLRKFVNLLFGAATAFLLLWGFNYANPGFATRANLPQLPDSSEIARHYLETMDRAMIFRVKIEGVSPTQPVDIKKDWPNDDEINNWVSATLLPEGYPATRQIRVRHIRPEGTLRRLNIAGIYNPFTGEANIDASLPPLVRVFTTAHEIAHAYGITSEAEANFVAWLSCMNSDNPMAQYAAEYNLWRYLAAEINRSFPEEAIRDLAAQIPQPLKTDREEILKSYRRYRAYFPEISESINDRYLKLQGVKTGTDDYNDFVKLYLRWYAQKKSPAETQ